MCALAQVYQAHSCSSTCCLHFFFPLSLLIFLPLGISEISMPEKDADREKAGSRLEGVMLAQAAGEDAGLLEVRWIP